MTGTQRTYVVAGSSGFIGTALVASLQADGHRVVRLVRRPTEHPDEVLWNPSLGATGASRELREALEGVHAVVNLAGAGIAEKRWDEKWKRAIIDSRVAATTCLATAIADTGPLREPSRGRVSRRVKSFPISPHVTLRPDEKAQRWLLNISASDRVGLLYSVARVLARHNINLQLAKIATLGERVDDTFLINGAELQHNRTQIEVETELLQALA